MPRYPCGCVNAIHEPSGILHSVTKCKMHRAKSRDPIKNDEKYYEALGLIRGGKAASTHHLEELVEALGPFPTPRTGGDDTALEVGCGVSPYARALQDSGWVYIGMDTSPFAAGWVRANISPFASICCDLEDIEWDSQCGFILAAHVLEHLEDAPGAIARLARTLEPGGEFWVIVPDDKDPVNPDHLWFFTGATLRKAIESAGLVIDRMATRKHVAHENFLYARARKPDA